MSDITAEKVKELREKSGAGMMDCKKALLATNGDFEKAHDHLRKEGVVKAAKKAGRATQEGLIGLALSPNKKVAALVELNCETDFVARTDQFLEFLSAVAEKITQEKPKDIDGLLSLTFKNTNVGEELKLLIGKLGENMEIRRFNVIEASEGEVLGAYTHAGSKIAVVSRVKGAGITEDLARDVSMHAAAMMPLYVKRTDVPQASIDRERDVAKSTPDMANKPANLVDKIVEGKINRYFSEVCLFEQPFIKDPSGKKSVGDYLKDKSKDADIIQMVRYQVGGEIN